jgi:hypothetical protein
MIGLSFSIPEIAARQRGTPPVPAAALRNAQGGYVLNAQGGYVLKG